MLFNQKITQISLCNLTTNICAQQSSLCVMVEFDDEVRTDGGSIFVKRWPVFAMDTFMEDFRRESEPHCSSRRGKNLKTLHSQAAQTATVSNLRTLVQASQFLISMLIIGLSGPAIQ